MKPSSRSPKISFTNLILAAGITALAIVFAVAMLTRNTPGNQPTDPITAPRPPIHYYPRVLPCDTTEQPDTMVRHEAWHFKNATINTVLDTVWKRYGVCYAFRMPVNNRFTGTIPKDASLNETLRLLVSMTPDSIRIERPIPGQIIVNPACP